MKLAVRAIAGSTITEALRSRLAWLLAALVLGAVGLSGFVQAVVPTESRATQAALLGAVLRLASVCLVAVFAVTSLVREQQDRQADVLLALPLPRAAWLLGRLAGFFAVALFPALLAGVLAGFLAPVAQAALWTLSLLCELWMVAAFALFCTLTLQHALPSLCATAGFYVLARSTAALQLLGQGASPDSGQRFIAHATDALAFVLPRLDGFVRSEWLMYGGGGLTDLLFVAGQAVVYLPLLAGAALFDLSRKEY